MPQGHKTGGTVAAEIQMNRMSHAGAFLVVEGKDDMRFWRPRRHAECELVDGEGKQNVVNGIERLDGAGFSGALGAVDDDCDSLESVPLPSPNLVATDAHDLECLLCRSSALDIVLAEFGDPAKIRRFQQREGSDVRTGLLNRGIVFGQVRWVAKRIPPAVDTVVVSVPRWMDRAQWSVKQTELIREADRESADGSALSRHIDSLPEADPWLVVHGHDLIEILRIGLMRVLGDLPASTGSAEIARVLRAAISKEELTATNFGRGIRSWELGNRPYAVLAA